MSIRSDLRSVSSQHPANSITKTLCGPRQTHQIMMVLPLRIIKCQTLWFSHSKSEKSNVLCITDRWPYFNSSGSLSCCHTSLTFQPLFKPGVILVCIAGVWCVAVFVLQLSTLLTKRLGRWAAGLFK